MALSSFTYLNALGFRLPIQLGYLLYHEACDPHLGYFEYFIRAECCRLQLFDLLYHEIYVPHFEF